MSLQDLSIVEDHDPHQIHAIARDDYFSSSQNGFEYELFNSLLDGCEPQQLLSELFMEDMKWQFHVNYTTSQLLKKVVASAGK